MDAGTRTPETTHSTDRVVEALSTLAAFLNRTISEVKELEVDFQHRLVQALHEKEAAVRRDEAIQLEATLSDTRRKLEERFSQRIAELASEWEEERARLNSELTKVAQAAVQWEAERARLNGEIERLARLEAAAQVEVERVQASLKESALAAQTAVTMPMNHEALTAEIDRVSVIIRELSAVIEDPTIELSLIIRKNVERAELESYVKGIRFALKGGNSR